MKRTSNLVLAYTLMLIWPSGAIAQLNEQCNYSPVAQDKQVGAMPCAAPTTKDLSKTGQKEAAGLRTQVEAELRPAILAPTAAANSAAAPSDSKSQESSSAQSESSPKVLSGEVAKTVQPAINSRPSVLKSSEDQFSRTLLSGSTFSVEIETQLTSKDNSVGDKVLGHLTDDLRIGSLLLAGKGAKVEGSVNKVYSACKGIKSNKLNGHFRNANGSLQIEFNKLMGCNGTPYEISASPAPGLDVQKLSNQDQPMVIDKHGALAVPYHAKRYEMISLVIGGASMAAGPFGFAAAPAVSALVGGICPAYGLGRPSHPGEKHPRVKGALMGALRGSPAGFLTSGFFVHGLDATVASGDQLVLQLVKPLTVPAGERTLVDNFIQP